MSDYLAINGVSEALRSLLVSEMEETVTISFSPPDLKPGASEPGQRINLFLYKIEENVHLRNQEIPGDGHPGSYGNPPLSIALHFMMTAFPDADDYSSTYDFEAHKMLADAMRVLNDYPIITDSMVDSHGAPILQPSQQNQFEKIKITLEHLDMEELTKIWLSLSTPYRLSVGYSVSVIQIESKRPRKLARPVKTRHLHLLQLRRPQIYDLQVTPPVSETIDEMPPVTARIGDTLAIHGANFLGISTQVIIGDARIDVTPVSDSLIEFEIPDDLLLQPGPTTVGVNVTMATEIVKGGYDSLGEIDTGENIVTSNQAALMLAPKITGISPANGDYNTILTITGERLYKEGLKSYILVGDVAIMVEKIGAIEPTPTQVQVSLSTLEDRPAGTYPVRIRTNGAECLEDDIEFELIV